MAQRNDDSPHARKCRVSFRKRATHNHVGGDVDGAPTRAEPLRESTTLLRDRGPAAAGTAAGRAGRVAEDRATA